MDIVNVCILINLILTNLLLLRILIFEEHKK